MSRPKIPTVRLDGKRALVACASSGIGLACAVVLAESGAHVTVAARRANKLEELASKIKARRESADILQLDVSDADAIVVGVDGAEPFDICHNAAGLARHSPALDTSGDDFDAVLIINLRGAFFLLQGVAKTLVAAGKPASLMTISSQMSHAGGQARAVYCDTKQAVKRIWGAAVFRAAAAAALMTGTHLMLDKGWGAD